MGDIPQLILISAESDYNSRVPEISDVFPAGPVLDERQQIGRDPFIEALEDRARDAEKIKLFAKRRTGKTSAARAVVRRFAVREEPAATVDLSRLVTSAEVANALAKEFAPGLAHLNTARRASGWLSRLIGDGGGTQERLVSRVTETLAGETLSPGGVLQRCSEGKANQAAAVLIDEAHLLAEWPEAEQRALREFLRNDSEVGVIVASSEPHALERLTQVGGPLEFVGTRLPLPAIAYEDWAAELPRRFASVATPITNDALETLLSESRLHPYCTMLLCRESVRVGFPHGEVTEATVFAALQTASQDEAWGLRDG